MRRWAIVGPLAGALLALGSVGQAQTPTVSSAGVPPATPVIRPATLEEAAKGGALIQKAVEAMGGAGVVDRVKTLQSEGLTRRKMPTGEIVEIPTTSIIVFPDRYRHEVTLPVGKMTTLITGESAFLITPAGKAELPEHEKFNIEDRILRVPVVLLRKRHDLFFEAIPEGPGEVEGRRVEWVRIQLGQRKVTWVALDAETGRIARIRYRERTSSGETGAEMVATYSDFRPVKGLIYPFEVGVSAGGQSDFWSHTLTLRVDEPVAESLFEPPAVGELAPSR